jgi:AGCS family alanine or glycine:cation symporter
MPRFFALFLALFCLTSLPAVAQDAAPNEATTSAQDAVQEGEGEGDESADIEAPAPEELAEAPSIVDPIESWLFTLPKLENPEEWTLEIEALAVKAGDKDGDGILDNEDDCPYEPEILGGVNDKDGCPDTDGDGIVDSLDKCPEDPEDFDGFEDEDGCPDCENENAEEQEQTDDDETIYACPVCQALHSPESDVESQGASEVCKEKASGFVVSLDKGFKSFDATFGAKVVAPLAKVLFWDAMFWDNGLISNVQGHICEGCGTVSISINLSGTGLVNARLTHPSKEAIVLSKISDDRWVESEAVSIEMAMGFKTEKATNKSFPIVVLWLVIGAVFLTLRMGFINLRGFKHAIKVTAGHYDNPDDPGEISHFQALSSALSATVGLGNIAGVAIAVAIGGPGAVFWMVMAGFLGMSSKFVECTLGQKFRKTRPDGRVMGGAMYYLSDGLKEKGLGKLGSVLAVLFAVLCIGGSFGGGNAFQVNQSLNALQETVPWLADYRWVYGLIMTVLVGVVIIGGLKRIASTAEKIVPAMCGIYVAACLYIMLSMFGDVPAAIGTIVSGAFSPEAGFGGFVGVLVQGFKRAAFSNEAGVGSAAIAHSAAKTEYPVREGIVSLLEPFIDTILVCSMTGIVIVLTGAYQAEVGGVATEFAPYLANSNGAGLTSQAFGSVVSWFPYVLSAAVVLFAFSTMISWSYYGERCWAYLFGDKSSNIYRVLFLLMTFMGSVLTSTNILDMSDLMILGMAFPNILGLYILSGDVRTDLDAYWSKHKAGEFKEHRG